MSPDQSLTGILPLIKDLGGWGAFIAIVFWGGRNFMAMAKQFSTSVVAELQRIREAIQGQEHMVEKLSDRIDDVSQEVRDQVERIEVFLRGKP
jgi:hypothetical protein